MRQVILSSFYKNICPSFFSVVVKKYCKVMQIEGRESLFKFTVPNYSPLLQGVQSTKHLRHLATSHTRSETKRNNDIYNHWLACTQLKFKLIQLRTVFLNNDASGSGLVTSNN